MTPEQLTEMFESLVAAQPDSGKKDIVKLCQLFFTNSDARKMIEDMVWIESCELANIASKHQPFPG